MANFKHISIDGTLYDAVPAGSYVTGVKGSAESTYRTGNVNLSKTNVGLGNVPNVTTNNQTPTFSQASTRDNLVSGEKLSVLFGKIMKWFADLKTVAFTGAYSDLSGQPTIPTVNNATLTIQKNGTNVQTFTANASSNKTANITVPTKTSELTNDSGYITNAGVTGVKGNSESSYRTGNVNITKANIGLGSVGNFKAVSTSANQGLTATEQTNARTNIGINKSSTSTTLIDSHLNSAYGVSAIKIYDIVYVYTILNSSANLKAGTHLFTLPAGYRPSSIIQSIMGARDTYPITVYIDTDGKAYLAGAGSDIVAGKYYSGPIIFVL